MKYIFTADLHLKVKAGGNKLKKFVKFLDYAEKKYDRLYILGDLFAYWYEHPKVDFYSKNPVLKELKKRNLDIYFIYGNRDFMAGKYFKRYSGVKFIGSELIIKKDGRKIYLTHGDKLAKKDIRYQIWRKFVRSPVSAFIFKRLPVGSAIAVVDSFKEVGKKKPKRENIIAGMIVDEVEEKFSGDIDSIIAAHAHYKVEKLYKINGKNKKLFILPEFQFPGEFLVYKENNFEFKYLK